MVVKCVRMWVDHDKLGCGWRDFVVVEGRIWATLIVVATGEHAKFRMSDPFFVGAIHKSKELDRVNTRKRLRRNAKEFGYDDNTVQDALKELM